VYKARHVQLKRLVALKMILAGAHARLDELERFRTEAEAAARLQHAQIVQIHEIGEHNGLPFVCLEFLEGGSLAQRLAGTPMPPRRAAALVMTLAQAMHAAHQSGIVHRDLKPANVLLTADGTPKISDFGLAKELDEAAGQTATGALLGTPSYMAPEQARGNAKRIGPASDIYALGAILY
jgi:serine/threonine-protein kinase